MFTIDDNKLCCSQILNLHQLLLKPSELGVIRVDINHTDSDGLVNLMLKSSRTPTIQRVKAAEKLDLLQAIMKRSSLSDDTHCHMSSE